MARKHISREFSSHRKDTYRPYDEFCKVEIISFEHDLTKVYVVHRGDVTSKNAKKQTWKSWTTLIYNDKKNDKSNTFDVGCNYFVEQAGEYRIDILYEIIAPEPVKTDEKIDVKAEMETKAERYGASKPQDNTKNNKIYIHKGEFMDKAINWEGIPNQVKRKELFRTFSEGNQSITMTFPKGIYFYGIIIRKTKEFTGDSLDSFGTNLMLQKSSITFSSQISPAEASFEIAYDNALENLSTSTGLYLDYNDEVNIYLKGANDKKETRVFGGYLSAIQPDKDRTTLTVSCADRMVDGQNKYVLTRMRLLGGATQPSEDTYTTDMDIDFDTYGQALKYLCNCLEITLHHNIGKNDLVTDETAEKGFNINYGKEKDIKKLTCKNATAEVSKNYITIRNKPESKKQQKIWLYHAKNHAQQPIDISDYNNFGIVYGLGEPEVVTESKSSSSDGDSGSGAAQFVGKQTFVVGLDKNNDPSDDYAYQNEVIRTLENAGHSCEKLAREPNEFANYSYHRNCNGKIGIYIIAAGTYSIADFYYGAASGGGSFKYAYFVIRADLGLPPRNQHEFDTHGVGADSDCPGWLCSKIAGMTFPEMNEKLKDKVHIVWGENGVDSAKKILNHLGGNSGEKTESTKTEEEEEKKSTSKKKNKNKKNSSSDSEEESNDKMSAKDLFQEISDYAFSHFRYVLWGDTCSDAACMVNAGIGDCWAFSEWIFQQLKKHNVNCRVVQYAVSGGSDVHRTVQYQNSKKEWVDFPYREYGWGTKYDNMLNNTSGSKNPDKVIMTYTAGGTIDEATGSTSDSSSSGGSNVKTMTGYSRERVIQGYFEITLSTEQSFKAKTTSVQVGFTQKPVLDNSITGFTPIWINNNVKMLNIDLLSFLRTSIFREDLHGENKYYLHSIKFIAPVNKSIDTEKSTDTKIKYKYEPWYTFDKSTHDYSSCKMDLYSINFNNSTIINPKDMDSCGKSISSLFEELLKDSRYTATRKYGKHRCDDKINFAIDNKSEPVFIAKEGDDNNILEISGISYTPRSTLYNNSTVVFKDAEGKYKYIDTRTPESILKYGEQVTLQTATDAIGKHEAYYKALTNDKYNPTETFNYQLNLPYFVNIHVGDLIQTIANSRKLNTIKTIASVKYEYSHKQIPKIQTDVGCGELPIDLQIRKELRELRKLAKKQTTNFSSTAEPVNDDSIYVWDN